MLTTADIEQRLKAWDNRTYKIPIPGIITHARLLLMWDFQCACCYICAREFSKTLMATRDHVKPKSAGGKNRGNILLACQPCNNAKGNRAPTPRERKLLTLYNRGMRVEFHLLLHTNTPEAARHVPRNKSHWSIKRAKTNMGIGFPVDKVAEDTLE